MRYSKKQAGKLIVLEGIDGSGKSTQAKLLLQRLAKEGYKTAFFDFPQYGKKSAGLIEEYLAGTYGNTKEVSPYQASLLYAADRYDASFALKEKLKKGFIVVADRYVGSNIGHQGGKIHSLAQREKFFHWLYSTEYGIFRVPKPTCSLFLHVPSRIAKTLIEKREKSKAKKKDIHEKDLQHLQNAEKAYLHATRVFPQDFVTIECLEKKTLLPPALIHERIWGTLQSIL